MDIVLTDNMKSCAQIYTLILSLRIVDTVRWGTKVVGDMLELCLWPG